MEQQEQSTWGQGKSNFKCCCQCAFIKGRIIQTDLTCPSILIAFRNNYTWIFEMKAHATIKSQAECIISNLFHKHMWVKNRRCIDLYMCSYKWMVQWYKFWLLASIVYYRQLKQQEQSSWWRGKPKINVDHIDLQSFMFESFKLTCPSYRLQKKC